MGKQSLYRYTCDECRAEVIADAAPRGWLRLLAGKRPSGGGGASLPEQHGAAPVLWTPRAFTAVPTDGYWCSAQCLTTWVGRAANKVVEEAKLK